MCDESRKMQLGCIGPDSNEVCRADFNADSFDVVCNVEDSVPGSHMQSNYNPSGLQAQTVNVCLKERIESGVLHCRQD